MNRALKRRQEKLAKSGSAKSGRQIDPHAQTMAQAADMYGKGNGAGAEAACRSILAKSPDHVDARHLLGIIAMQQKDFRSAIEHLQRAASARPDDAAMRTHLGTALSYAGELDAAAEAFEAALAIDPRLIDACNNLAALSMRRNNPDAAIGYYRQALSVNDRVSEVHANLANALLATGKVDEAIRHYRSALAIRPRFAEAEYGLAQALRDNGDMVEAASHYTIALEQNRSHTSAMTSLAAMSDNLDPAMLDRIGNVHRQAAPESEDRKLLSFALARQEERKGNYERAAELLRESNALHRATLDFSIDRSLEQFDRIKSVFDQTFFDTHAGIGVSTAAPIFIVGMPRSGTSLVEQILASHPDVNGGGELIEFPAAVFRRLKHLDPAGFPDAARLLEAADAADIASQYLGSVGDATTGAARFTDKLPGNFLMIGMIRTVFPNARIVHCTRDMRDTCLSMFKIFFPSGGHHFSYELSELIAYHRAYDGLMRHWTSLFGDQIIEANYETIVGDTEASIRSLLSRCDLEFDPRCLDFHTTRRVVRTASAAQVRKPIYASSIGAWKNFAPYLPELGDAG